MPDHSLPVLALIDPDLVVSLIRTAIDTALTLSPLAVVVLVLLVPYIYRILFLRARVDKRSYQQTRSRTAPIVRKMRRRLDFEARHWSNYVANPRGNLKFRIEVSLFYDLAKAAAAYHASGQWDDFMRQQGILQPIFIDEEHPLSENLEKNGFFQSTFFEEGVANRYLMRQTTKGHASVQVQTDADLRARATGLFKEALKEIEPQYEEGHIYLPFLKLSRWERIRFRIHTMIITKMLSDGMQKGMALVLSYGLVHLLKGESVSRGAVDFIMDIVALLFMTHIFDSFFTKRYSDFKVTWEDRERFFYRRQIHQFLIGLDEDAARAERAKEKEALQLLGERSVDPRGIKRIFKAIRKVRNDPREPGRLLAAAQDVLDYTHEESTAIGLVLLKELAAAHPATYERLMKQLRRRRHRWRDLDPLVQILLSEAPYETIAKENNRRLPAKENAQEWQRAVQSLQRDFPEEIDRARTELLLEDLLSSKLTPLQREALILTHFLGGLLWRLRLLDPADPLSRGKDARLYQATQAYTIPALVKIHAQQKNGDFECALEPVEISSMINRINQVLPLPAGHRQRREMAALPQISLALDEIQEMVLIKQSPVRSTAPELAKSQLKTWLDDTAKDEQALGIQAHAIHGAYRSVLAARIETHIQSGTGELVIDPRVFDSHFNPHGAETLQRSLAPRRIDGETNEAVLTFLGFLGSDGVAPAALAEKPVRLCFLDLQPVVEYILNEAEDAEVLEEITHQALVEFYHAARMAKSIHDLPDALIRPSEGDDRGGSIARQMTIIRSLKARMSMAQEPVFLLLQETTHELDHIVNPLHASLDFLIGQASRLGPQIRAATRLNLYRLQDTGRALLVPLACMANQSGFFEAGLDRYWAEFEECTEQEKFLRQFDVNGREHADAIIRARILLHHYESLRSLFPAAGERTAYSSFDTMAGDADLLKISAAIIMSMIDQSGLRTKPQFSAVRKVLSEAMNRQGFCKRGNLSDLVRVTLKERDEFGNTVFMTRSQSGDAPKHILQPTFPLPSDDGQ